mgnify:FL=1
MSSQSSVYSEKKIAAYESLFRESNFAKPQEVYLTLTVAHVFGQAYIVEQEGTKEGDAVYSRFVCPLEEITKVYVNDKIKKPWPLFIQCDTNVKGVIHRKRIVIPCLENPTAIAEQINQTKAVYMEKYEAAVERENQKKRAELENNRMKEQIKNETKKVLPPLPTVEKLPDPIPEPAAPVSKPAPAPKTEAPKASPVKSVKDLASDLADSFKAFESMENSTSETKPDIKPLPKKPVFDLDNLDEAFNAKPKFPEKPAALAAEQPETKAEAPKKPELDLDSIPDAIDEIKPEPAVTAPKAKEKPAEPVVLPAAEPAKPVEIAEPVAEKTAPKPAPAPIRVNPNAKAAELNDFESAVIKLKERLDSGEISAEEYAAEKKKLISTLY